ncbi:SH2 domain-containing protein 1A [Ambystoma mexicanum]|uniref:SH2 domain-containing protein 1A n=1 Tax=Ambystoma mexicanum TaxID=8296 RepID=UPI0037E8927A
MESVSVYHGKISRETGERLLASVGLDGSYLLRDSESIPGVYCLCVLCQGFVYTYRIHQSITGSWTADTVIGVKKRYFRKVENLILAYQEADQGIAVPLMYPVEKNSVSKDAQGDVDSGNQRREKNTYSI